MYSIPPYGENYLSPAPPLFETPFITAADGTNNGQPFPHTPAPLDASPSNPGTSVDWSRLLPVNGDPYYYHDNDVPYTRNYMFSIDRQLGAGLVMTLSYVGSQGRNILVVQPTNPGDPALCLSVSQESQVAPGSATCGPFSENGVFTRADGTVINGTRPFAPDFGSITAQRTIGRSLYNAFEADLRYTRRARRISVRLHARASRWTRRRSSASRSIRSIPNATWAPSAFDVRHNFIASYNYDLPFERLFHAENGWTKGWAISGITRLSSGFPVTLYNDTDSSLLGTFGNGVNNHLLDTPNYTPGCDLKINHDPGEGRRVQHGVLLDSGARPAGQRAATILLRTGHHQHRPHAAEERLARESAGRAVPSRDVQRVQHGAVLWRRLGGRQRQQLDVRPDRASGAAAARAARG